MHEANTQVAVSIIVPVYNTERFVGKCIESLLDQSYKNLQIVLVNDGSTDNSPEICRQYAQKDSRILYVDKENGGVSSARNAGMAHTVGEFICFVDSDDYVAENYIEALLEEIENFDVVACGCYRTDADGNVLGETRPEECAFLDNNEIRNAYIDGRIKHCFYGPVAKLYRAGMARGIEFDPELPVGEDIVFNLELLKRASSVKVIGYLGYYTRQNISSTTHKIAQRYTPLYEHSYKTITDALRRAKAAWGFDTHILEAEEKRSSVMRYYHEITNLFRPGTPYLPKEIRQKISQIHADGKFISGIISQSFTKLGTAEKVAYVSAKIKNTVLTYFLFKSLLRIKKDV